MAQLAQRRKEMVASMMKDGIYQAAVEILMEHGPDALTMDRIAETAGVAKGSLYNYFRNKREMIAFIHDKAVEPAQLAVREMRSKSVPAPEKLETILRMWFEHFARNRGIFDFLINDPRTTEVVESCRKSCRTEGIEDLTRVFAQGAAEGSFRPMDAARTAEMFLGAVITTCEQQTVLGERRPVDESVESLMELFLKGLEPR